MRKLKNAAVTVDVETDWGGRLSVSSGNCQGIKEGIPYLLHLLNELKIKATFFVSGEVVSEYAGIIHSILEHGHELASHGFRHNVNYSTMSKIEIKEQINNSKKILEEEVGVTPIGFRAPQFRMSEAVYEILHELNYGYDSSVVRSVLPTRYNNLSITSKPFVKSNVLEIPISTMPYLKVPMGLLWINAMGFKTFRLLSERYKFTGMIVFYMHPFDLIETKSKKDFGFFINKWYDFKSNKVKYTLEGLLNYWKANRKFVVLENILEEQMEK